MAGHFFEPSKKNKKLSSQLLRLINLLPIIYLLRIILALVILLFLITTKFYIFILVYNMFLYEVYSKQINLDFRNKLINKFLFDFSKQTYSLSKFNFYISGWKDDNVLFRNDQGFYDNSIINYYKRKDVLKIHGNRLKAHGFTVFIDYLYLMENLCTFETSEGKLINPVLDSRLSPYFRFFNFDFSAQHTTQYYLHIDTITFQKFYSFREINNSIFFNFFVYFQKIFLDVLKEEKLSIQSANLPVLRKKYPWEIFNDAHYLERILHMTEIKQVESIIYRSIKSEILDFGNFQELENTQIINSIAVVDQDFVYVPDRSWSFEYAWVGGINSSVIFNNNDKGRRVLVIDTSLNRVELDNIIFGFSKDINNYWHFLFDILIPLQSFGDERSPDFSLAIRSDIRPKFLEILKRMTDRNIVLLNPMFTYHVKKLLPIRPVLSICDDPASNYSVQSLDELAINQFKNYFLSAVSISEKTKHEKICFSRKSSGHRNVSNKKFVFILLKFFGYNIIDPSSLSIIEQISFSRGAKSLIIFGGAAVANSIFVSKDTIVNIISSDACFDFSGYHVFKNLCPGNIEVVALGRPRYSFIQIRKGIVPSRLDAIHLGYRVRLFNFTKLLMAIDKKIN
jgi:hypothetical protein